MLVRRHMTKNFSFMEMADKIYVNPTAGGGVHDHLPPGVYTIQANQMTGQLWFQKFSIVSDSILDLPSPEYSNLTSEMRHFLKPETKDKYKKLGYLYKRSALLYGPPGTGKTCIINRVSKDVVSSGGIVLYVDDLNLLKLGLQVLSDTQPNDLTLVIFEEFDRLASINEGSLLTLLDGQEQKENVMYLATTNYINKIPKRLYRPGRLSTVLEVKYPVAEARHMYLSSKLGRDFESLSRWVEVSEGLSVDELKELIQSVELLGNNLESAVSRIKDTRSLGEEIKQDEDEDEDYDIFKPMKASVGGKRRGS